ncbi:hypothetical protein AVEN_255949-1 [Araneus ventricosus]|uniref:Uncharacterized protein n=1 Tax=Araneus ventricosus TaxID=182803 RepID=A0A4Y2TX15_ARAVE|nr:hypothetical protein AVEN_255949-1 [Araneus ventricosus]
MILAKATIPLTTGSTRTVSNRGRAQKVNSKKEELLRTASLKPLKGTFFNALRPKLLPSRSEGSLGGAPFPSNFYHLEASNVVEMIHPKLPENKTRGFFMVSWWFNCRFTDFSEYKFGKMCDHKLR